MADIRRYVRLFLDRVSAKKMESDAAAALRTAGEKGGENFFRELRSAFDKRMAELREQLASGLIDEKEFRKQAQAASKSYNEGLLKNIKRLRDEGKLTDKEYVKLTRSLKRVGDEGSKDIGRASRAMGVLKGAVAGVAAYLSARALGRFFAGAVREAEEASEVWARLGGNVENAGVSFADVRPEIEEAARAVQNMTKYGDEDYAAALSEVVSVTGDYTKSLKNMDVVLDLATAKKIDLRTAAQLVGRAMVGETGTLKRYGIIVREGADAVEVMRERFHGLAEIEGKSLSGRLQRLRNEWGDVKEAVGEAIAGGDEAANSLTGIAEKLVELEKWIRANERDIREFTADVAKLVTGIAELAVWLSKPFVLTLRIVADPKGAWDRFWEQRRANRIAGDGVSGLDYRTPREQREAIIEAGPKNVVTGRSKKEEEEFQRKAEESQRKEKADRAAREKADADEVSRLKQGFDLRVLTGQELRRLLDLEASLARALAQSNLPLAERVRLAGQLQTVRGMTSELGPGAPHVIGEPTLREGSAGAVEDRLLSTPVSIGEGVGYAADEMGSSAERATGPWIDALGLIKDEVESSYGLFGQLADAWVNGGIAGLARLAKAKVKENLAWAVEQGAKALGWLALGNAPQASAAGKSAAMHTVAAAAWGGLGAIMSGGGGSRSGSDVPTSGGAAGSAQAQTVNAGPSVHIYIDPLDPHNPAYQRNAYAAVGYAKERYGEDASVHIHPRTGRS